MLQRSIALGLGTVVLAGCTPRMGRLDLASPAVRAPLPAPDVGDALDFVVLGDFGHTDDGAIPAASAALLDRVEAVCGDCDFVVLAGDNQYPNGVPRSGDTRFLDALADRLEPPLLVVLGNHDWGAYWWPFGGANRARARRELAWITRRDDVLGETHFWTLDAGPARIVGLDSTYLVRRCRVRPGSARTVDCRGQDGSALVDGLRGSEDGRWTVAVGHHPWISDGWHGDAGTYHDPVVSLGRGRAYRELLERLAPDLHVAGHDHHSQLTAIDGHLSLVAGAGSEQRLLPPPARPTLFRSDAPGFVRVHVDAHQVVVEMHENVRCTAANMLRDGTIATSECGD